MVQHRSDLLLFVQWHEPAFAGARRNREAAAFAKWEEPSMRNMPYLREHASWEFVSVEHVEAVCFLAPSVDKPDHSWVVSTGRRCVFDEVIEGDANADEGGISSDTGSESRSDRASSSGSCGDGSSSDSENGDGTSSGMEDSGSVSSRSCDSDDRRSGGSDSG